MNFTRNTSHLVQNSGSTSNQRGAAHTTESAHHDQPQRHYGAQVPDLHDILNFSYQSLPPPVKRSIQQAQSLHPNLTRMPTQLVGNTNKIAKDSSQWRSQHAEADSRKLRGSQALKHRDLQMALIFYDSAYQLASELEENKEQMSILCSNMSYVFHCMKRYEEAANMATLCHQIRPLWYKGFLRLVQASVPLEKWDDVYSLGIALFIQGFPLQEQPKVLCMVLKSAAKVGDGYDIFHDEEGFFVCPEAWSDTIALLVDENSWDILRIVILGNELTKPLCASYTCQAVKLHGLLQTCSVPHWRDWGQRLAIKLLQNGAPYTTLSPDGKYPLHEAFKMCLKTGCYELLKHLFLRHVPQADRQSTDANNNTLLHLACQSDCPSKATAVKLLLEFGFDCTVRNLHGHTPVNFLASGDSCHSLFSRTSSTPSGWGTSEPQVPYTVNSQGVQISAIGGTPLKETADYLGWSKQQVKRWIGMRGLDFARERLAGLDGELLAELKIMQVSAPQFFLETLQKQQGMSTSELLQLTEALRDL